MKCCFKIIGLFLLRVLFVVILVIPIVYLVYLLVINPNEPQRLIVIFKEGILFIFSSISLFILIRKFFYVGYCSKRRFLCSTKKIADIINWYDSDYVIFAGENSSKFIMQSKKHVNNNIKYINVDIVDAHRNTIPAPTYDFRTSKFYGFFKDLCPFKHNDKIIIFDDIVITGETASKIKETIIKEYNANPDNILIISYGAYSPTFGINKIPNITLNYFDVINHGKHTYYWRKGC